MFWNESIKGMGRPANSHRKYASIRGYFMANVDSEQDRYRVLEHPAWFMVNSGFTIQLWDIHLDPRQELPTYFPVWVKLKFLPIFGSQSTSGRKFLEDRSQKKRENMACAMCRVGHSGCTARGDYTQSTCGFKWRDTGTQTGL